MRTLFITLFQGAEAKSILRTDICKILMSKPDVRVVFFVASPDRADFYRREFSASNVFYEVVENVNPSWLDKLFSSLKFVLLNTSTVQLRRRMSLETGGGYLGHRLGCLLYRLLDRRFIRKAVRWLDYALVRNSAFVSYFDKYEPDLVLVAHLFDDLEIHLLREACRHGVKTLGFVNSWDKLTSRGSMRLLPDRLMVFNNIVRQEAIRYADMDPGKIEVVGVPNYDWHVNYQPLSRSEFFFKKGLDSAKRLVVYAPMGKTFSNSDWDIIDLLEANIKSGRIKNAQFLVRFQPNDFVDEDELKRRPGLVYDLPGVRFSAERGVDWDMSFEDIKGLTDTLANADVFVCYASSMSIDAAIFDKPVINIDFEVRENEPMSKSPTYFYQMTHYRNAVKSGGISYPKSKAELINQMNRYLENPALDQAGRQRLVKEQCWKLDGKAGQRIANIILESI